MYTKEQLASVSNMNKATLREACKAAGIAGYGKMTVARMREVLQRHIEREMANAPQAPVETAPAESAPPVVTTAPATDPAPAPTAVPAAAEKPAKPARVPAEERNGVRAPIKGVCRDTWDALSEMLKAGTTPTSKEAREFAEKRGWNENNTLIELARWKKFNGIAKSKEANASLPSLLVRQAE